MPKAKTIDRIELTKKKMQASKAFVTGLKLEKKQENEAYKCPNCGGEMIPSEGCQRCKKCGWSKC